MSRPISRTPKPFEVIDWDEAGPDDFEYERAATGRFAPLPIEFERINRMFGSAGIEAVERAAAEVLHFKMTLPNEGGARPKRADDWKSADEVIYDFLGPALGGGPTRNRLWGMFMTAVTALAKRDTRYWGVKDPSRDRWCSRCRTVQPKSMYSHSEFHCDKHFKGRRKGGKRVKRKRRAR